ncbi:Cobalamin biosynthesis protein cbiB [Desulfovibrio sp. X2]|uniref:CobD/CbiB family cobalamin biosynthesis protein n=1 Tax=Desulfovibrio sp. X2 TaxID=941449 RepID=UPI000358A6F3|nr:CobD/CbiB family cobalamin biosynthesis protein [Desulfovibrio sp. X2]EPR41468.1 Cobalamin biosynthesis protein cbiB [Desulfovibrio sp. X2]
MDIFGFPGYWIPLAALALDLAFGDPQRLPHPVRLIGRLLDAEEAAAVRLSENLRRPAGIAFVVCNAALAFLVAKLLCRLPAVGPLVALYLAFAGLALGQLLREGRAVSRALEGGRLDEARGLLAGLVTRDTSAMGPDEVRKALAETLSENLCDGLVAPFFFLVLGGVPLLWAYKTVSTMDSMWGYRTPRFERLGFAAARTDDVLAFLPARLTALALLAAGWLGGRRPEDGFTRIWSDARRMESPNAGWPMSAAAWVMDAAMGGPAVYFGKRKDKPVLGPAGRTWSAAKLNGLERLLAVSGFGLCLCMLAYFGLLMARG